MIGTTLGEQYRLLAQLGEGAMGRVYLAEDVRSGRQEAIKVLRPDMAGDAKFVSRFRREARATNRLQHPNIIGVYDFGQLPDGSLYLAMEYADGIGLNHLLRREGPLEPPRAVWVLAQLARAIEHAHQRGVIHRDLKPENLILIDHRGQNDVVKVLDFGIGKIIADDPEAVQLTRQGEIFGTPHYMAPEQFHDATMDPRSDIYAVGCIGFELLVGSPPWDGSIIDLMTAHTSQPPPLPSERRPNAHIPTDLDDIIAACMAKQPADRFQTGGDLANALERLPIFPSRRSARDSLARLTRDLDPGATAVAEATGVARASRHQRDETTLVGADAGPQEPAELLSEEEVAGAHREALRELAEGLLDQNVEAASVTDLTVGLATLLAADDDATRLDAEDRELVGRADAIEQQLRERAQPLRFAIGELRFDSERAGAEQQRDLEFQIRELEQRLSRLLASSDAELEAITSRRIDIAAERAVVDDKVTAGYADLERVIDTLIPVFQDDFAIAPMIDRFLSIREHLGRRSNKTTTRWRR